MKKQITGLSLLDACPDWVQYYWQASLDNHHGVDKIDYNEEEDHQVFFFIVSRDEEDLFPDLKGVSFVRLWELPEGQIVYEAYVK